MCVATTTVIGCVPKTATKTIAWAANLSSVVLGEIYSTLKNMGIAEKITKKQQRVLEIKERLSLQRYNPQVPISMETILQRLHFPEAIQIRDIVQKIEQDLHGRIPSARRYAYINASAQLIPSIAIVIINILANLQQPSQTSSDDSSSLLTPTQWLNLILGGGLIIVQYFTHSSYIAKNLRKESDEIKAVHKCLEEAQRHLLFRAIEFGAFRGRRHELEITRDRAVLIMNIASRLNQDVTEQSASINTERLLYLIDTQHYDDINREEVTQHFLSLIRKHGGELAEETLTSLYREQANIAEETRRELVKLDENRPQRTEELAADLEEGLRLVNQQP